MNSLPKDIHILIFSLLDGGDYLSTSTITRSFHKELNDPITLSEVQRINNYPFLVYDAGFYFYSYCKYFVTVDTLKFTKHLGPLVRRTTRSGKLDTNALKTVIEFTYSKSFIKEIVLFNTAQCLLYDCSDVILEDEIIVGLINFPQMSSDLIRKHPLMPKSAYYYLGDKGELKAEIDRVRDDDIAWFQNNTPKHLMRCVREACHKNRYDLLMLLIEKKECNLDDVLSFKSDSITTGIVLASNGKNSNELRSYIKNFVLVDNAAGLNTLLTWAKVHLTGFDDLFGRAYVLCVQEDAVACFGILLEFGMIDIDRCTIDSSVSASARGIRKFYNIKTNIFTNVAASFFHWLLK
jgi:hypothetical protein